jgi:hypothetical protein
MRLFLFLTLMATPIFADTIHLETNDLKFELCDPNLGKSISEPTTQDSIQMFTEFTKVAQTYCCKVCKKGQACGNSCISWDKTCHQPPGCACQG